MAARSSRIESATLLAFPGKAHGVIAAALKAHRLPESLAAQLLRQVGLDPDTQGALAQALAARMTIEPLDVKRAHGILLIGATGSGKSTVAAQIREAAANRETLLLDAGEGLGRFRAGTLPANALVVMEADGFHPLNPRARGAFAALNEIKGVEVIGVVSALADAEDVGDMVAGFRFKRLIVTSLDRTRRLGALTAAVTSGARLAHVVRGGALESLGPAALAQALLAPLPH